MRNGLNQESIRNDNLLLAMDLLRKTPLSTTDLAREMNLSKPALCKIIDELNDLELITECQENLSNTDHVMGRKKQYYTVNNIWMLGVIVIHPTTIEVSTYDMELHLLQTKTIEDCEFVTFNHLLEVRNILSEMIRKEKKPLVSLGIASPGRVYKDTFELEKSPKLEQCKDISFYSFFGDYFHCVVKVANDINLYIIAEEKRGSLKEVENAALIYIDAGIGGAVLSNHKLIMGDHGFAGEFGLIKTMTKEGKLKYIDAICSTNGIKESIQEQRQKNNLTPISHFKFKQVLEMYQNNDEITLACVHDTTKIISELISNLYNIFDCREIRICGRVRYFKEDYLNQIRSFFGRELDEIHLAYTELEEDAVSMGAAEFAMSSFIEAYIAQRKKVKDVQKA